MQEEINIEVLFEKYINRTINQDELSQLHTFFQTDENEEQLEWIIEGYFASEKESFSILHEKSAAVERLAWNEIQKRLNLQQSPVTHKFSWIGKFAAAAVLLVMSSAIYFVLRPESSILVGSKDYSADVQPGTSRATLISSKGLVYQLNGAKKEIVTENGAIRYKDGDLVENQESDQNVTLITPRGGQYRVTLSDGTKVWLNAGSSLSYPPNFVGKERRVQLTGEAYFEVAHNVQKPFVVMTDEQQVKVLGTSFNLNAYSEERKTVTTLVNGRVQLSGGSHVNPSQLQPGQQAVLEKTGFVIAEVDPALFAAWKDGQFRFKATPLVDALRQIARWYDLDIDYTGIPTDIQIHASIGRDKKLSTVIHALEKISDLKFNVKGRSVKLMR